MAELYGKHDPGEYRKERELSVFPADQVLETPSSAPRELTVYNDIKTVISRAEAIVDDLAEVGEAFSIPIAPEENTVRAAHLQLGGDGKSIKFQEYMAAIQEHQHRRGDYLNPDFNGLGAGDMARIREKQWNRHKNSYRGKDDKSLSVFDNLAKYGANAVLLYLLNEQLGANHAADHAEVTSGKLPPATETGSVLAQILQGMIMIKMVQGMTDDAIESYQNMDGFFPEGIDTKSAIEQFKIAGPPKSDAFGIYRAQMASHNHETLLRHSVRYCASHISEGYESWLGYLTARSVHEDNLKTYFNGKEYKEGSLELAKAHEDLIKKKTETSDLLLTMVGLGLGKKMDWGETCCLLRFIDIFTPNVLNIMRTIIQMSIAALNSNVQMSFNWSLDLANHPNSAIHEKLIKMLDGLFDKIVGEFLDAVEIDNSTYQVLKACTPIGELLESVLAMIQELKKWYHDLLRSVGIEINTVFDKLTKAWQTVYKIKRAKEILLALDKTIEKAEDLAGLIEDDNIISGMVGMLDGSIWSHSIPGAEEKTGIAGFTESALDWCRKIGDWDYISSQIKSITTENS